MRGFLEIVGLSTVIVFAFFFIYGLYICVKEGICKLKWQYRYKHRFDKPPIAKCYCIDCKHHNKKTRQCYQFGQTTKEYRCTADDWFCWEAEPREDPCP